MASRECATRWKLRRELRHEQIEAAARRQRASPEIDALLEVPCQQDRPDPVDHDTRRILVARRAEALAPRVPSRPVEAHGEGLFEATLSKAPEPGEIPVAATVMAGGETDLLAGELDVHEAEEEAGEAAHAHGWEEYAYWIAAAGIGLVGLIWLIRRMRAPRLGGVA